MAVTTPVVEEEQACTREEDIDISTKEPGLRAINKVDIF